MKTKVRYLGGRAGAWVVDKSACVVEMCSNNDILAHGRLRGTTYRTRYRRGQVIRPPAGRSSIIIILVGIMGECDNDLFAFREYCCYEGKLLIL